MPGRNFSYRKIHNAFILQSARALAFSYASNVRRPLLHFVCPARELLSKPFMFSLLAFILPTPPTTPLSSHDSNPFFNARELRTRTSAGCESEEISARREKFRIFKISRRIYSPNLISIKKISCKNGFSLRSLFRRARENDDVQFELFR